MHFLLVWPCQQWMCSQYSALRCRDRYQMNWLSIRMLRYLSTMAVHLAQGFLHNLIVACYATEFTQAPSFSGAVWLLCWWENPSLSLKLKSSRGRKDHFPDVSFMICSKESPGSVHLTFAHKLKLWQFKFKRLPLLHPSTGQNRPDWQYFALTVIGSVRRQRKQVTAVDQVFTRNVENISNIKYFRPGKVL